MNTYHQLLHDLEALKVTCSDADVVFDWSEPMSPSHGILSSSVAFKLAKQLSASPVELARSLADQLNDKNTNDYVAFESAGPYINVVFTDQGLNALLEDTETWTQPQDDSIHILYEYVSLNVAKKPHLGHMRNINIGEALLRILKTRYTHITTDNHWGDWGVQFGIVIWAYKRNLDLRAYLEDPLSELQRLYVWGNQQQEVVEDWDEQVRAEFKKLEDGEAENKKLWQEFVKISQEASYQILELFNVTPHDLNQGESFYEPYMEQLTEFMEEHSLWEKEEQARYIDFELLSNKFKGPPQQQAALAKLGRCYLISSAGYTTYAYRDVAARLQWAHDLAADKAITLTDYAQNHNFAQAFAIIAYLAQSQEFKQRWGEDTAARLSLDNLIHVPYGRLRVSGQQMSSRKGTVLNLESVYQEVIDKVNSSNNVEINTSNTSNNEKIAIAALKWSDLNRDRTTDVDIDPDAIVAMEGDTGVYQLYTLARLYSVLRKVEINQDDTATEQPDAQLLNQEERSIISELAWSSVALAKATAELKPHYVAVHVRSLAQKINGWYGKYSVAHEPDTARQQQLLMFVNTLVQHLEKGLDLLAIEPVSEL